MNTSATSLKALTTLRTKKAIALLAFCRRKDGHGIGHGATLWSFVPQTIQKPFKNALFILQFQQNMCY
jgi:hypothetical protein